MFLPVVTLNQFKKLICFLVLSFSFAATSQELNCEVVHDLPLVTHYSSSQDRVVFGAADNLNYNSMTFAADFEKYLKRETDYAPLYRQPILPNKYLADNHDVKTFPNQDVINSLSEFCRQSGVRVQLKQARQNLTTATQLRQLIRYNVNYWQIIHSIPYKNNLFSIVLPPNLSVSDRLPFLINGAYDLNSNFMTWEGPQSRTVLSAAFNQGVRAAAILWNGMGGIGSRTMNDQAYQQINEFMALAIPVLKLNSQKAISLGGSRGGVTALNLASHSAINSFRVAYVDAAVPAADPLFISELASPTVPLLLPASDWTVGFAGSWMNSFRYPASSIEPRLVGLTGMAAHYSILTNNFQAASYGRFKLQSSDRMAKLNQNNTAVFLEIGSHDFIVPFADQVALGYDYYANVNNVEIAINYLAGHYIPQEKKNQRIIKALVKLATTNDLTSVIVNKNVQKNIVGVVSKKLDSISTVDYTALPLTVEVPRYIVRESPVQIILTSTALRKFQLIFSGKEGDVKELTASINDKGYAVLNSQFSNWPNTEYYLNEVYELSAQNLKISKLIFRSTVTRNEKPTLYRYDDDVRPFALNAAETILTSINGGGQCQDCAFEGLSTNYGIIEIGREMAKFH